MIDPLTHRSTEELVEMVETALYFPRWTGSKEALTALAERLAQAERERDEERKLADEYQCLRDECIEERVAAEQREAKLRGAGQRALDDAIARGLTDATYWVRDLRQALSKDAP